MKRKSAVISLVLICIMLLSTAFAFAGDLSIESVSPQDGKTGLQPLNVAVKVRFNQDMMAGEDVINDNLQYFSLTDSAGTAVPLSIAYNEKKEPNELLLLVGAEDGTGGTLTTKETYTFTVQPGVQAASGDRLAQGLSTTFTIRNTKTDNTISILLMVVMMVVMFAGTIFSARKKAQEEAPAEIVAAAKLNPYKIAKERGISLDEAKAYVAKEKEKAAKALAKHEEERRKREAAKAAEIAALEAKAAAEKAVKDENTYHVKARRSVKEAGGRIPRSVIRKNQAKRERAKAQARAAAKNKSKK